MDETHDHTVDQAYLEGLIADLSLPEAEPEPDDEAPPESEADSIAERLAADAVEYWFRQYRQPYENGAHPPEALVRSQMKRTVRSMDARARTAIQVFESASFDMYDPESGTGMPAIALLHVRQALDTFARDNDLLPSQ